MQKPTPTLAIDFDGVLHAYTGWVDFSMVPKGDPVPGAEEFLRLATFDGFRVVIYSTRAADPDGRQAIEDWLDRYNLRQYIDAVTAGKPPALVYLDDRAILFDGTFPDPKELLKFRAWWEETSEWEAVIDE
jgi:hypothetical protein